MPRCRHNPNLPHRSGFKALMSRDLERRLARAEISAPETSWGDRKAADRRQSLRTRVALHQPIRERLRVIGVDPAVAESLRPGDEAAAELAAIPDTPELERAVEAIVRANCSNGDDGAHHVREKIARMAQLYRSGQHRVDFANAGAFELLAFALPVRLRIGIKCRGRPTRTATGRSRMLRSGCAKPDCLPIARIGMSRVSRFLPLVAFACRRASADLLSRVRAELSPVDPIEELLADRVVNTM